VDPLEDDLRDLLTDQRHALPTDLVRLARVHAGASRRRRRRAVATSAAAVLLVAVAGTGFAVLTNDNGPLGTTAAHHTPTGSTQPTASGGPAPSTPSPSSGTAQAGLAWDGAQPVSLTATSTKTFVVLGYQKKLCKQDCLRIVESHDGGATYDALPVPADATPQNSTEGGTKDSVGGIRFGSAVDGWLFGNGLWATHDGGQSWTRVTSTGYGPVLRLEAAAGTVWALVGGNNGDEQLWSSPIGSDSWKRVAGISVTGPGDLSVQGKQVVVAGAQDSTTWSNVSGTFAKTASPCPGAPQVSLSGFDGVWAACATGTAGHLAYSADALHWSDVPLDLGQGSLPNDLVIGAGAHQRATVGLPGDPGLVTLDAATGKILHQGQSGTGWSFVGFTDASVGYAISVGDGTGQLLRTDDGGATWHALDLG
jgi:hypothetical protein